MNFFKKTTGRPSQKEKLLIRYIQKVIKEKNIPDDFLPVARNLEELYAIRMSVDNYKFDSETPNIDTLESNGNSSADIQPSVEDMEVGNATSEAIEQDVVLETQEVEEVESIEPLIEEEPHPVLEVVSDPETIRENLSNGLHESTQKVESDLREENQLLHALQDEETEEYDPFAEPIIQRSYNHSNKADNGIENEPELLPEEEDIFLDEASSTPVDDLSSASGSKATARKTAKTLINLYAKIKSAVFKHWAKFDIAKIERLEFAGKLDTSIEVEEGVTFMDHVVRTNQKIDEAFEMEEDVREDLIESLADVVEEKKMVMSPSNRFFLELFSDLAESTQTGYQLSSQNNRILTHLKHMSKRHKNAA